MILIASKFIKAANQVDLKIDLKVVIICNQNSSKAVIINILLQNSYKKD